VDTISGPTVNSQIRTAGYFVLTLAALFPLLDLSSGLWPTNFANATWRFGAVGLLSNYAMGLSLELFLLAILALWANHRRVLLVLGVISVVLAIVLLGSSVLFVLDALQTRARVTPAMIKRFDLATAGASAKLVLYAVANLFLARGEFLAARRRAKPTGARARGLVVPAVARPVEGGREI
jgi:hypothetical protein